MSDVTQLLEAAHRGDRQAAAALLPLVYDELRKLASARLAAEKPGQTLQATALVHEAYLRLVGDQHYSGRGHFFAAAAEAMRRILVEQARRKATDKHGGGRHRVALPDHLLAGRPDSDVLAVGKPVPKVIDFGLAKATTGLQLTEHTLFTAFGTVAGTPLYMAPEQATFNAVDVDSRADIYALGVILYELLSGSTPIHRDTLKTAALDEMLRVIREQEPPPPSSRISTLGAEPSIATNRQSETAKLGRFVRGELDWIVMKALSKERERRYESATAFAADVERFLANEPVTAGPPSQWYRLRKPRHLRFDR